MVPDDERACNSQRAALVSSTKKNRLFSRGAAKMAAPG
jgi:hypothetical protein